ncbi:hypothetical protein HY628_00460 [Candidatus Uhrbacteria bacterium]|nr:hypothetical protein [Candidatus Uhrbacteria bacterium]
MKLFFVLGREPALSLAELFAVLGEKNASVLPEIAYFEVPETTDPGQLMNTLGGTIKIGRFLFTLPRSSSDESLIEHITQGILQVPGLKELPRIRFGLSVYHGAALRSRLKSVGIKVKRALEKLGFRSRWVVSREATLSSVVVQTNRLLTEGAEIELMDDQKQILLGRTVAVQPFEAFEERDFVRPARDATAGMLPPKLARMMVNLAGAPKTAALLDPFCGMGTILMEATLLGYQKLLGGDLNLQAVQKTSQNIRWLINRFQLSPERLSSISIFAADVRHLPKKIKLHSIQAIVTEPFLGPPQKGHESLAQLQAIHQTLSPLYQDMLRVFQLLLTPNGCGVIAFPRFRFKKTFISNPILAEIKKFGFKLRSPFPENFRPPKFLSSELGTDQKTLIYGRPDQRVWREIAVIEKIKGGDVF